MTNLARRYNKGKLRYELVPTTPLAAVADVYTRGAHKYSIYRDKDGKEFRGSEIPLSEAYKYELIDDGADNWRKGMPWLDMLASIERHIQQWKSGEDIDQDLGTKHLANAAWGLLGLLEYEKTHPELDNRNHTYLTQRRIGLDIDGVLADFTRHIQEYLGRDTVNKATHWNDPFIRDNFGKIAKDEQFWATIPPLISPTDVQFEPAAYITARSISKEVTQKWLDENGFPKAPLICVGHDESKIKVARDLKLDAFVDDKFENFVELTKDGLFTYLMDAPYNRHYNVGFRRIYSLKDIV